MVRVSSNARARAARPGMVLEDPVDPVGLEDLEDLVVLVVLLLVAQAGLTTALVGLVVLLVGPVVPAGLAVVLAPARTGVLVERTSASLLLDSTRVPSRRHRRGSVHCRLRRGRHRRRLRRTGSLTPQ